MTAEPVPPPARASRAVRIPGEAGLWVLIVSELVVFTALFTSYAIHFVQHDAAYREAQRSLDLTIGLVNTLVLLTSSLFVVGAVTAIRAGAARRARTLTVAAMLCGAAFAALKIVEYADRFDHGITPSTQDSFFAYFFSMTGLHFVHVVLGLCALTYVLRAAGKPDLDPRQRGYVEGAACYWHMVDLLWILIFPLLYLVR